MTIEQLERAGRLLYGDQWQSNLARELDIDSRRIRQWVADKDDPAKRPISDWVYSAVVALLRKNHKEIGEYLSNIT